MEEAAGRQQDGAGCSRGLTSDSLPVPPSSGLRSYPLRGSHSLDDLLDRPGNSTAPSEYWDGQSRSRTPTRIPSRAPSPAPTPLPDSRRSSMGSPGVASDVKVSAPPHPAPHTPSLSPVLGSSDGQGDWRPGNPPCLATGWLAGRGPSQPSLSLPICREGVGRTSESREGDRDWSPRHPAGSPGTGKVLSFLPPRRGKTRILGQSWDQS